MNSVDPVKLTPRHLADSRRAVLVTMIEGRVVLVLPPMRNDQELAAFAARVVNALEVAGL